VKIALAKSIPIVVLLFCAVASAAVAQNSRAEANQPAGAGSVFDSQKVIDAGPKAPDTAQIMLPDVVLKVPDIAVASIAPELPPAENLRVPDIGVPLPDQGPLHIPDQAFDVPLPGKGQSATARSGGSSIYNTGSLGVGSMSHLAGAISVYKLGDSPRFRLEFSHEGLDGFAGKPAGTGYFTDDNSVGGWLSTGGSASGTESMASFQDHELGLQNNSDNYYSVGVRTFNGYTGLSWNPDPLLSFGVRVEGGIASRLFSLAAPATSNKSQTEYTISPSLTAGLNLQSISFQLRGSYGTRLTDGLAAANNVNLGLFVDASLPAAFLIRGDVGTYWTLAGVPDTGVEFPWSLEISKTFDTGSGFAVSGGYRIEPMSFSDLWSNFPLLQIGSAGQGTLIHGSTWFGKLGFTWSAADLLFNMQGALELDYRKNVLDITGYSRPETAYLYRQTDMTSLVPTFAVVWSPTSFLSIRGGLQGKLLNRATQEPLLAANGSISLASPLNRFGGGLSAAFGLFESPVLPNMSANLFARISDGVELDLNVEDFLAPLLPNGRPIIGSSVNSTFPFILPGFRITLSTHISL